MLTELSTFSDSLLYSITTLNETLLPWINQYGTIALFFLLTLGIIALPIPDEPLLMLAGSLIAKGELSMVSTIIASILGAWCGITVSYLLGAYLGTYIVST